MRIRSTSQVFLRDGMMMVNVFQVHYQAMQGRLESDIVSDKFQYDSNLLRINNDTSFRASIKYFDNQNHFIYIQLEHDIEKLKNLSAELG